MLPVFSSSGSILTVTRDGNPVGFTTQTIKGIQYAFFPSVSGSYTATYGTPAPTIVARDPMPNQVSVSTTANVTVEFSEPMNDRQSLRQRSDFEPRAASSDTLANVSYASSIATLDPQFALLPATVYHVTISGTVADTNGNLLGADDTWSFTTGTNTFTDTTVADFSAGITANTYVGQAADGEVILAPTVAEEFSGTSLPAGWSVQTWDSGGAAAVAGGKLTVDGSIAITDAVYASGRSLESVATFGPSTFQHAGFGDDLNSDPLWALFSTKNTTTTDVWDKQ